MKVTAVTLKYPPLSLVGAWIATHEFLVALRDRGHDVTVLTTHANRNHEHDGIPVHPRYPNNRHVRDADVLISHLGDDGRTAQDAARFGIPSVRMVHGSHPSNRARLDRHPPQLAVFNSAATLDEVGEPAWPSIVCHPPVHPERYRTSPGDRVTLVNMSPAKGGIVLSLLARAMPDVQFLGVRGAYGLQHVTMPPNVEVVPTTADMRSVYGRTRVLLMPSERESWGRVGVEAMASGIPVIAHPTGGLVESLGAAGIFVDRERRADWMAELRRLADPAEWAEASARALARSAELDPQADLDRFADAVESLVGVAA